MTTSQRNHYLTSSHVPNAPSESVGLFTVATGQGKVREIQGQGKVRGFCAGSGKLEILRTVRELQENPFKVREI